MGFEAECSLKYRSQMWRRGIHDNGTLERQRKCDGLDAFLDFQNKDRNFPIGAGSDNISRQLTELHLSLDRFYCNVTVVWRNEGTCTFFERRKPVLFMENAVDIH